MAGCSRRYKTPHKADVQEIRSSKPNWTLLWPPELTTGANIAPHSPLFPPTMDRQEKWAPSQLRTIWKRRFKMVVAVFGTRLTPVFHSWKLINYYWDHIRIELMSWLPGYLGIHVTGEAGGIQLMSYAVLGPWSRRSRSQSGDSGLRVRVDTWVVSFNIIIPAQCSQYTQYAWDIQFCKNLRLTVPLSCC